MTWQSMDTAPKDREILVWGTLHGSYGYVEDREDWVRAQWSDPPWSHKGRWNITQPTGRYHSGFTAKLWMPAPEPPTKKEQSNAAQG
jgi:hypothetical protein